MRRASLMGFLFGLLFPILGTFEECLRLGASSLAGIVHVQRSTPLLWIIDSAPFVLAGAAYLFALSSQRAESELRPRRPYPLALPVAVSGLILCAAALFGYARYCNNQAVSLTTDVNLAGSLRNRSLRAYIAARDGDSLSLRREQDEMAQVRRRLQEQYPLLVAEMDAVWASFHAATVVPQIRSESQVAPHAMTAMTAEDMSAAADRLTQAIVNRQQVLAREARSVFLVAVIVLLAILPISLGLIFRARRAEAATQISEARLIDAQAVAAIGSWEFDIATGAISWSREVYRVLGFDPAGREPDYETLMGRYHPEDVPTHRRIVAQAVQDGKPYSFDIRAVMDDGAVRWIHATGRGFLSATGTVTRLMGTVQDITERKSLEQRLRESERRLTEAQQTARIGSWEYDLATGVITWSREIYRLLGYEDTTFEPDLKTVVERYHPDDRALLQFSVHRAITKGIPYQCDLRVVMADGEVRWFSAEGRRVEEAQGKRLRLVGTLQDITIRKQLEEESLQRQRFIEKMVQTTPDSVYIYSLLEQRDLYRSQHEALVLGYRCDEIEALDDIDALLHPEDRECIARKRETYVNLTEGQFSDFDYRARDVSGKYRWINRRETVFARDSDGKPTEIFGIARDVTTQREAQMILQSEVKRQGNIAETLQQALLELPEANAFPNLDLHTVYRPAWDEARVGGDFYDVIPLRNGTLALVVGDIMGKGLAAAAHMAEVKFSLRSLLRECPRPVEAMQTLNRQLYEANVLLNSSVRPTALTIAVLNPQNGELQCAVAGMDAPRILRGESGEVDPIPIGGLPLGALPEWPIEEPENEIHLGHKDVLLLFTDGVTEAECDNEMFGNERLAVAFQDICPSAPLASISERLLSDVEKFTHGRLQDDICLLLARRRSETQVAS